MHEAGQARRCGRIPNMPGLHTVVAGAARRPGRSRRSGTALPRIASRRSQGRRGRRLRLSAP